MKIPFDEMKQQFKRVLLTIGFTEQRAALCSQIFAENSRDGVYSHGLNRFPVFVQSVKDKLVDINAEPEMTSQQGSIEFWDGHFAPGMYTATLVMNRTIALAKEKGVGCITVKNTNHWMRGGTYGWQAANAGCIGICSSNTIANMPAWGCLDPRLGNNPLIIAVPYKEGHVVLDMAMSQFSYGKLQEYQLAGKQLPVAGGYDGEGRLSMDPSTIFASKRTLPIGFWKGSGLSFILDVLISALSGGRTVKEITEAGKEFGLSQFFLCIDGTQLDESIIENIIRYTKESQPLEAGQPVLYPGERTLATRERNLKEGIPVNEKIWQQVLSL